MHVWLQACPPPLKQAPGRASGMPLRDADRACPGMPEYSPQDACPCNYAGNYYSNKRWCCGERRCRGALLVACCSVAPALPPQLPRPCMNQRPTHRR